MKTFTVSRISIVLLACSMMGFVQQSYAEIIVIVNPGNTTTMTQKQVQRIFLGKLKTFPNASIVIPIDLPQKSDTRIEFSRLVIKKDMRQVSSYWSRLIFTGKGLPPKQVNTGEEARELVARNPDAIAYIDASLLDDTVRQISFE